MSISLFPGARRGSGTVGFEAVGPVGEVESAPRCGSASTIRGRRRGSRRRRRRRGDHVAARGGHLDQQVDVHRPRPVGDEGLGRPERRADLDRPPCRSARPRRCPSPRSSRGTQSTRSSRRFQISPSVPPGRSTRAASGGRPLRVDPVPGLGDGDRVDARRRAAGSPRRSPPAPAPRAAPRRGSPASRSSGSTAITSSPRATSARVSLPVPAPRSSTVRAPSGSSQSTAASGIAPAAPARRRRPRPRTTAPAPLCRRAPPARRLILRRRRLDGLPASTPCRSRSGTSRRCFSIRS